MYMYIKLPSENLPVCGVNRNPSLASLIAGAITSRHFNLMFMIIFKREGHSKKHLIFLWLMQIKTLHKVLAFKVQVFLQN